MLNGLTSRVRVWTVSIRRTCAFVLVVGMLSLFDVDIIHAGAPARVYDPGPGRTVGVAAEAWHSELEDERDYAESWYYVVVTDAGGLLLVGITVTNLGVRTFDVAVDAHYYGPQNQKLGVHREFRRDDITAQGDRLDFTVGNNRIWRENDCYHLLISEKDLKVRLELRPQLKPHQVGDGRIQFDADDATSFFAIGLSAPRSKTRGTLEVDGKTIALTGLGYHGHSWATIKLPSFLSSWFTIWLLHPEITLVMHEQSLSDDYGSQRIRFGVLGDADKLIGGTRSFVCEPEQWERDTASGYTVPSAWRLAGESGGYHVSGTLTRERLLDSIDVLGALSWPVRTLVKAFYGRPFNMRYIVRYDLVVVDGKGKRRRIGGLAPLEASYYEDPQVNQNVDGLASR